jgi:hypothetical protein
MTDTAPILVVFGTDREGEPRASQFTERDAELAIKAAGLLGFRSAWVTDVAGRAIAEALPNGNVFAPSNGFIRRVRQSVFERLSASIDGGLTAMAEQRGSDGP